MERQSVKWEKDWLCDAWESGTGERYTDCMGDRVKDDDIQRQREAREKLEAIRKATEYSFPTGDIEELLAEIERGRRG